MSAKQLYSLKFNRSLHDKKAELRSITDLLNCYCREYAAPKQQVFINPTFGRQDWPDALKVSFNKGNDQFLLVLLPESQSRLIVRVKDLKSLGQCRYTSAPYLKKLGSGWHKLDHKSLTLQLLKHLAVVLNQPLNNELYRQIQNSLFNSQQFLSYKMQIDSVNEAQKKLSKDGFIHSEQALIWGHAWHPTPKSREGISQAALMKISPEVGACFQLNFLAVKESLLKANNSEEINGISELQQLLNIELPKDYRLLPCHPYQFEKFKNSALFIQAIEQKLIVDLGKHGSEWYPTSSVRTLYNSEFNFFLKFSLHVRLTNCIRKNAWYELESAIFLTNVIEQVHQKQGIPFTHFIIMREPSSVTLDLRSLVNKKSFEHTEDDVQQLSEAFGLLFRTSFDQAELDNYQPRVAGALFSDDEDFASAVIPYVKSLALAHHLTFNNAALLWFENYLTSLLTPVLYYFFKLGIIFEPHLQNTVIGFTDHLPTRIYLRDLEGTKLIEDLWPQQAIDSLSERAKQSIHYDRAQGWRRIAYCTLINNISEAIYHLSGDSKIQEQKMWRQVRHAIIKYQQAFGREIELDALLAGENIPCKCNFMTRLLKRADKEADYVYLTNPMGESLC
ncbi:IucA/IucC family protein [Thalassotalea ganghwensis]